MSCDIGKIQEIGGKRMECVPEKTKGCVYRKGCYWVYTDKIKAPKIGAEDLEYFARVGKKAKEMEKCEDMGGYWLGTTCYFSGEESHPPITPQISPEEDKEDEPKEAGETCGGAVKWISTAIVGGRECGEGLECIDGVCRRKGAAGKLVGGIKTSLWSIGLLGVLLIGLLIALGYSQMGGVVSAEHKKRRG